MKIQFYDENICLDHCIHKQLWNTHVDNEKYAKIVGKCQTLYKSLSNQMNAVCVSNWEQLLRNDLCTGDAVYVLSNFKLCDLNVTLNMFFQFQGTKF